MDAIRGIVGCSYINEKCIYMSTSWIKKKRYQKEVGEHGHILENGF